MKFLREKEENFEEEEVEKYFENGLDYEYDDKDYESEAELYNEEGGKDLDGNVQYDKEMKDLYATLPQRLQDTTKLTPEAKQEIFQLMYDAKDGDMAVQQNYEGIKDDGSKTEAEKEVDKIIDDEIKNAEQEDSTVKNSRKADPWVVSFPTETKLPKEEATKMLITIYGLLADKLASKIFSSMINNGRVKADFQTHIRDLKQQGKIYGIENAIKRFPGKGNVYMNNVSRCMADNIIESIRTYIKKYIKNDQEQSIDAPIGQDNEGNDLTIADTIVAKNNTEDESIASAVLRHLIDEIRKVKGIGLTVTEAALLGAFIMNNGQINMEDLMKKAKELAEKWAQENKAYENFSVNTVTNASNYLNWGKAKLKLWQKFGKSAKYIGQEIGGKSARSAALAYIGFKNYWGKNGDPNKEPQTLEALVQFLPEREKK